MKKFKFSDFFVWKSHARSVISPMSIKMMLMGWIPVDVSRPGDGICVRVLKADGSIEGGHIWNNRWAVCPDGVDVVAWHPETATMDLAQVLTLKVREIGEFSSLPFDMEKNRLDVGVALQLARGRENKLKSRTEKGGKRGNKKFVKEMMKRLRPKVTVSDPKIDDDCETF